MTMYHFTCVAPFLAWCLIGAVAQLLEGGVNHAQARLHPPH